MDKWFKKFQVRHDGNGYFDDLTVGPNAPYATSMNARDALRSEIEALVLFAKGISTSSEIEEFLYRYYHQLQLSGEALKSVRFIRWLPTAKIKPTKKDGPKSRATLRSDTINRLDRNPNRRNDLLTQLNELHRNSMFFHDAMKVDESKSYKGKDQEYLRRVMPAKGFIEASNKKSFLANPKSFAVENVKKILLEIGIVREGKKHPDWASCNNNIICVGEDKFQVESGGGQNNGKEDGLTVFDYRNDSPFLLRKVFGFDGEYEDIVSKKYFNHIDTEHKIMSLLDIPDFIGSGE